MVIERLQSAEPGETEKTPSERGRKFAVVAFTAGTVVIAIWSVMLAFYADPDVRVLWIGFDTLEIAGLGLTAWLTHRRDARASLLAAGLSAALICDVWFDVSTATPAYRTTSLIMAGTFELPFAAVCAIFALRTLRASLRDAGPAS